MDISDLVAKKEDSARRVDAALRWSSIPAIAGSLAVMISLSVATFEEFQQGSIDSAQFVACMLMWPFFGVVVGVAAGVINLFALLIFIPAAGRFDDEIRERISDLYGLNISEKTLDAAMETNDYHAFLTTMTDGTWRSAAIRVDAEAGVLELVEGVGDHRRPFPLAVKSSKHVVV